jgi:hypothetical protein
VLSCVEPSKASPHDFYIQFSLFKIDTVNVGNLQFFTSSRLQGLGDFNYFGIIEKQPGYGITALGMPRLFFNANRLPATIKLHHPLAFGIVHRVRENCDADM